MTGHMKDHDSATSRHLQRPVVAVLEPHDDTRVALGVLLDDWGYDHVAGSSSAEILGQAQARGAMLDVIVCDYRLAGGSSGIEAALTVRSATGRNVPVIVTTSGSDKHARDDAAARGFPMLAKPFRPADLQALISRELSRSAASTTSA
jgi:CheY-like chemotaxis protein